MRPSSARELARYIDHTLLKPDATKPDIERLCAEALQSGFHAVCVHGSRAALARRCLAGSPVQLAVVVGFPLGAGTSRTKAFETQAAVADGATEIDVVLNIGLLKEGALKEVRQDLVEVIQAAEAARVKVILECCLLTREEKILACQIATEAGVAMVKTSTGFSTGGATVEDVRLLRDMVPPRMGVKASGGIRELGTALAMIEAGATRLGTSSGTHLLAGLIQGTTHSDPDAY